MCDIVLSLTACEGALVRVLGLMERRGYPVDAVQSRRASQAIELTVAFGRTSRSLEVLARQLRRLHEVQAVRLETENRRAPAGPAVNPVHPQATGAHR